MDRGGNPDVLATYKWLRRLTPNGFRLPQGPISKTKKSKPLFCSEKFSFALTQAATITCGLKLFSAQIPQLFPIDRRAPHSYLRLTFNRIGRQRETGTIKVPRWVEPIASFAPAGFRRLTF